MQNKTEKSHKVKLKQTRERMTENQKNTKQPSKGGLRKGYSEYMVQSYRGEHPCRSAISIKFQKNFIEITLRHGCSPVNLLYIFRTPFPKKTSGGLLLAQSKTTTVKLAHITSTKRTRLYTKQTTILRCYAHQI